MRQAAESTPPAPRIPLVRTYTVAPAAAPTAKLGDTVNHTVTVTNTGTADYTA